MTDRKFYEKQLQVHLIETKKLENPRQEWTARSMLIAINPVLRGMTIFSLPKRRTFLDNNYYQPYKLFCKAGKNFLDICWTLTAFDNYTLIISTNTAVYFLNLLGQ